MSYLANMVAGEVALHLKLYCRAHRAGDVLPEQSFRCFPLDDALVRRQDVAFIPNDRTPAELPTGNVRFAPDLAVELISPTNTAYGVDEELDDDRSAGVRMVWVINPDARVVRIYQPGQPILEVRGDEMLRGDPVLPGFAVAVSEFWPTATPPTTPAADLGP